MADRDRGPVVRMADLGPAAGVAAKRPVACGVVSGGNRTELERRVVRAAGVALAERKFVTAIDVLVGVGWLQPAKVAEWRQGRVDYLERAVIASLGKISTAMRCFRAWARARGLKPSETAYVARTRDRRPLRFSKTGDPEIERADRTHWVSPELSDRKRARLAERQSRPPQLVVISPVNDFTCSACGSLSEGPLMMEDAGPVCLGCADMDHLVFLASGDAALTRRAKANSRLSAVVVRFSRARKRYERQGILVEEAALDRAEAECLADEEAPGTAARARRAQARRSGPRAAGQDGGRRSPVCFQAVRLSARRRSRVTRRCAARAGSGARPRVVHSITTRSSWRSRRPSVTRTPLGHAADVRRRARSGAGRGPLAGSSGARRAATLTTGSRRTPICEPEPRLRRAASTRQEPSAAKSWTRMLSRPRGSTRATLADLS